MKKTTFLLLALLLFPALPGCALCEWLMSGHYEAADRADRWNSSTGSSDWQQSEF